MTPEAVERFDWLEKHLPSAVTHKDTLEATMKKAASNAKNPRKAAVLNETALGWPLVSSSCYPWVDVDSKNRSRKYEVVAMAAIFEHTLTARYRPKLLSRSSVAHLRLSMAQVLQSHSKHGRWDFPDGLVTNWSQVPATEDTSLAAVGDAEPLDKNTAAIVKIINVVENSIAATSDGTQLGVLDGHVADALYQLVLVGFYLFTRGRQLKHVLAGIVHECR
jgi:hypothetical protein